MVGTGRGAQLGILIKGPEVLESTRTIDTVVLDKTGTVTTGRMTLHDVIVADGEDRARCSASPGALENASEHPIAAGHRRRGPRRGLARCHPSRTSATPKASACRASSTAMPSWSAARRSSPTGRCTWRDLAGPKGEAEAQGRTPVVVGWDGAVRGVLVVADTIKESSAEAVRQIRELGLRPGPPHRRQRARCPRRRRSGRHRRGPRRGAAGRQGRRHPHAAGAGPHRRDGRRRGQRRRRAGAVRPRPGNGHRHRRRDRGGRPDPRTR